jgi:hypothetical protein
MATFSNGNSAFENIAIVGLDPDGLRHIQQQKKMDWSRTSRSEHSSDRHLPHLLAFDEEKVELRASKEK